MGRQMRPAPLVADSPDAFLPPGLLGSSGDGDDMWRLLVWGRAVVVSGAEGPVLLESLSLPEPCATSELGAWSLLAGPATSVGLSLDMPWVWCICVWWAGSGLGLDAGSHPPATASAGVHPLGSAAAMVVGLLGCGKQAAGAGSSVSGFACMLTG